MTVQFSWVCPCCSSPHQTSRLSVRPVFPAMRCWSTYITENFWASWSDWTVLKELEKSKNMIWQCFVGTCKRVQFLGPKTQETAPYSSSCIIEVSRSPEILLFMSPTPVMPVVKLFWLEFLFSSLWCRRWEQPSGSHANPVSHQHRRPFQGHVCVHWLHTSGTTRST